MEAETVVRYLASRRARIVAALEAMAARRGGEIESMGRIVEFCLRGKMIRGCLVLLGAEAALSDTAGAACDEALARIAVCMELFQAGLLAHDDIMDRDETRRGAPTLHARYAAEALAGGSSDYLHVGESLGICLGDLCYFEAFAELARAVAGRPRGAEIQALCAERLAEVAVAQMADVRWGVAKAEVPEADILAMYRSKTARYSFSLPLAVGALFADDGELPLAGELADRFSELGEHLGILFQIRDDELGLFGSPDLTGKALGSDLREGKKTLFRARLLAAAPSEERPRLVSLFGGSVPARPADIAYIRRLAEELGVMRSIGELSRGTEDRAETIVGELRDRVGPEAAEVLEGLVDYVTRRDR
ncbi:MAG: polyprenyl synthetase family protein [Rectinemataceae bacterium]|jgi:geranylgeranyl diphosphate synthase type I